MTAFQLAMAILTAILAARKPSTGNAVSSAIVKLTSLYNELRNTASQNAELTAEEEALLDENAEAVFASPAADPEANK